MDAMETKKMDMDALDMMRRVSKQKEAERAFIFGYFQGLEAAALVLKQEEQKTA